MIHYDEVTTARHLRPATSGPSHVRASGYAVEIDQRWFWFPAIEPAYVFARAGRMAPGVTAMNIVEASTETKFDHALGRDVSVLTLLEGGGVSTDAVEDQNLVRRFAEWIDSNSSYWPVKP